MRIFRDLLHQQPVVEVGRLRLWIHRGRAARPAFYWERTRWHTTLFGAWRLRGMWFNRGRRR